MKRLTIYNQNIKRITKNITDEYSLYYVITNSDQIYTILEYWEDNYLSSYFSIWNVFINIDNEEISFSEYIVNSNKIESILYDK